MKRIFNIAAIGFVFFALFSGVAFAEHEVLDDEAIITWDANTEEDIAGYQVFTSLESGVYGGFTDVGLAVSLLFQGLSIGEHFFVVTAYDTSGNISGFSMEVSKVIAVEPGDHTPPAPPTNVQIAEEIASAVDPLINAIIMLAKQSEAGFGLKVE